MTEREIDDFELDPSYEAAVRLRRIDNRAKILDLEVPPLSHYTEPYSVYCQHTICN